MILKNSKNKSRAKVAILPLHLINRIKNRIIDYSQEVRLDHFSKMQKLNQVLMNFHMQNHDKKIEKIIAPIYHYLHQFMSILFATNFKMIRLIKF